MISLFTRFERLLEPTATPTHPEPPNALLAFYRHYARQAKGLFLALLVLGFMNAVIDLSVPVFIGRFVGLFVERPEAIATEGLRLVLLLGGIILVLRPLTVLTRNLVANQALAPGFSNLVRWQTHWHVVRQSWAFFQNDFAGRIANRIMQTGPAVRESMVQSIEAVWYITVYGTSALLLLFRADPLLALPLLCWLVGYATLLRLFVPRLRDRSRIMSEVRSLLTGRIVDSYTNILTVKLFARAQEEDAYVRDAVDQHTTAFRTQLRLISFFGISLQVLNGALVTATAAMAVLLLPSGAILPATIAMMLPLTWQIVAMSGAIAQQVTQIFENIGVVQEGMTSIAHPLQLTDRADARPLVVGRGELRFESISFGYGRPRGVIQDLSLHIRPGEKIGLVGRSGSGKSTLVNVLLRFFDLEAGRILIDGQDIAGVTQESLRAQISVVTQDTSLLHRSIRDNIRYGRPWASEAEVIAAAERASAAEFIPDLSDLHGRRGYDAHVGERGVKLSGGQRQRIAIARIILKDAPILVLDEATSALDSEVEAAIQASLEALMEGKTVIAIAHRLSTIARMDRLVILDHGRIVETGSHAELLALGGHYAKLWQRQSGGFLDDEAG
jgi:ATP-binding cassette subfamily B multidrug efflux pump